MTEPQKFDTHVCLVSDQATPNLLPLLDERWRPRKVVLATSSKMRSQAEALESLLQTKGVKVETLHLRDVYDYAALCDDFQGFLDAGSEASLALNVTGGTKLMAVAAQEVFRAYSRPAFYVSIETDEIISLTGGHSAPLDTKLKIVESLRAHGYVAKGGETPQVTALQRDLAARLIDRVSSAGQALGQINRLAQEAKPSLRCRMTDADLDSKSLSNMLALFADAGYVRQVGTALTFPDESSRFFVGGGWLEYHLLQVLRDLQGIHPITDIAFSLKVIRSDGKTDNEIDVAFMYRNTLHIIECKSANLARSGSTQDDKAKEAVYRMESLLKLGGLQTHGMIVDYRGAFTASDASRFLAQRARIETLSGSELKDAKAQIERRWLKAPVRSRGC